MCTVEKRGNIFILTITTPSNPTQPESEHRLNPTLITSLRSAISSIKSQSLSSSASSALITTATGKFFSNGFDLTYATSEKSAFLNRLHEMVESFKPVIADLLSLPMPTIAAVNGHAAAAGLVLALAHDYVIMRKDKGVVYMSEVDIGMTFPEYFSVFFGEKFGWKVKRELLMFGRKVKGEEGVKLGIVDEVFESEEEVFERGVKVGEEFVKRNWDGEVFTEIRKGLVPNLCVELGLSRKSVVRSRI